MRSSLLALAIALAPATALPTQYAKTAIVSPTGGDYPTPNAAMSDLANWCGTPSASNRCLVKIMPGVYTLTPWLTLWSYVDIEGSGANVTVLQGTPNAYYGSMNCSYGGPMEVRGVTVEAQNGGPALQCTVSANLRVVDAAFRSSGNAYGNYPVSLGSTGATVELDRVTATMTGSGGNVIQVFSGAKVRIVRSTVIATCDPAAVPSQSCTGVYSMGGATTDLVDSRIEVSGAAQTNLGVYQFGAGTLTLSNVQVNASLEKSLAVYNAWNTNGTYGTVRVEGSRLTAVSSSQTYGNGSPATYIANTRVEGTLPSVYGKGTVTCVGAYTGDFKPLTASCQLAP